MTRIYFVHVLLIISLVSYGQRPANLPDSNKDLIKALENIRRNPKINSDSTFRILSAWNKYPRIDDVGKWYLFVYKDLVFGDIPLQVYIPGTYKNNVPTPTILILHGATGLSRSFENAYKDVTTDESLFYSYFSKQNFIIIKPFANIQINFDWVINRFNGFTDRNKTNSTFQTLTAIIQRLKSILNIDDKKVFAFGHSDGSDGVFALEVYKPSLFAGFIAYNSMLLNLSNYDIYIRNTLNHPLYLVHSDLDDLRPIQQTRLVMRVMDSLHSPVQYKEYIGYKHYDKHLKIDLPFSYKWMENIRRNPNQKKITWELSDAANSTCDWLHITQFNTLLPAAEWQTTLNTKSYNKRDKVYESSPYYDLNNSAVVKAVYNNNIFDIQTSRIKEIELLLSPVMVNFQNPVIVKFNGKTVFNKKVVADKMFLLNNFASSFDRQALWSTSIKVETD